MSSIAGQGSIRLSDKIVLQFVLHVLKLSCNLLFVSCLSKDSNFRVVFCTSLCEFQDLNSRTMIGSARLIDDLYYFDDNRFENKQAQGFIGSDHSIFVHEQIMLWHNRLGHPSFFYLKHLFLGLFKGLDCTSFDITIPRSKLQAKVLLNLFMGGSQCIFMI